MELARKMILSAKENGADLVKFQLYDAEDDKGKPHYEWVKKAELTFEQAKMLFDYGAEVGIEVFFSVFGIKYVKWCEKIGVKRYKIASTFSGRYDTWFAVKQTTKPIISSFADLPLDWEESGTVLYCPQGYPQENPQLCDLQFPFVGFSDHTIGLNAAKVALASGVQIIEKHFILDRNSQSPEREWSMTPNELRELKRWEAICQKVEG